MSGHSKWSQIKRKKGLKDAQRGQLFSKTARLITLAVTEGGGIADPEKNAKLRLAIEKARAINMPKDNIARAIERAQKPESQNVREVVYEGLGPSGVALMIAAATDNPNRASALIRSTLEKHGGKLAPSHSLGYLFKRCGLVVIDKPSASEKAVFDLAEALRAEDMESDEATFTLFIPFEQIGHVKDYQKELSVISLDVHYRPLSTVAITSQEEVSKLLGLIETLETLDEVYKVYSNADIPDAFNL